MELTLTDYIVFVLYFIATITFALFMAWRQKEKSAEGFFMASHKLPWYVVGASIIAAGVSAEHFIGTVGWAYLYGMAVANWQWAAVWVYSVLIWVFLPYYMRGSVSTMPEFLERRFNKTCRYIYAFITIVGMVIALLGGVTFAGAKALNVLFPQLSIPMAILLLGAAAGLYNCANQVIVQRFLGARSEWDARMGVVMAGFTGAALPFVIVFPGLIAFYMFQTQLSDGDQAWPYLAKVLLPPGLTGFVLAGLAAAIMSTLSAIVHSSATVLTLDLYKPLIRPNATDAQTRLVGRVTGTVCVLIGLAVALALADSFTHHTFVVFVLSVVLIIVLSLFTKPKSAEELKGVIWDTSALRVPEHEKHLNRGWRNFVIWWGLMVAIILTLYVVTNSRSVATSWTEAEQLERSTPGGGSARIQLRKELKGFNLWTGAKQVLFQPAKQGDTIRFALPVKRSGRYELAAVVTQGPGYGKFTVKVDGSVAKIGYNETKALPGKRAFMLSRREVDVYDAGASGERGAAPGYVVRRVSLGAFTLNEGTLRVEFVSEAGDSGAGSIGVDQLMLTQAD